MEYKRKKSRQYGDFVEIVFENEEEYQDLLEKYKSRIEYLKSNEYNSSSEEAMVSSFERLKRVSDDGTVTTAFFGNNCLDALYVAISGIYSNFYLNENYCLLKEMNEKMNQLDETNDLIIQKLKEIIKTQKATIETQESLICLLKEQTNVKKMLTDLNSLTNSLSNTFEDAKDIVTALGDEKDVEFIQSMYDNFEKEVNVLINDIENLKNDYEEESE